MNRAHNPTPDRAGPAVFSLNRGPHVFIICSPCPRVGRTLLARLLTEFLLLDRRPVAAFDVAAEPELATYLPAITTTVNISDTRGQMLLFDRLVANDGVTKVVDVAREFFAPFFALLHEIGFIEESRLQAVELVILFMTDTHRHSVQGYRQLLERLERTPIVPVYNEAVTGEMRDNGKFPLHRSVTPLRLRRLSPFLPRMIDKPGFSFADYLRRSDDSTSELSEWLSNCFVEFRELQLRLLLEEFRPIFQRSI